MTKKKTGIRFMKHFVTDGTTKVRVTYSSYVSAKTGTPIVALYAKEYGSELYQLLPELYRNDTDTQTDYFEKGAARIPEGHPLYAAALERTKANEADSVARYQARRAKEGAKATPVVRMPEPEPEPTQQAAKSMPVYLRDRYIAQLDDAVDRALEQSPTVFMQDKTIVPVSYAMANATRLKGQFPEDRHLPLSGAISAGRAVTALFDRVNFKHGPDFAELKQTMKELREAISRLRASIAKDFAPPPQRVALDSTVRYLDRLLPAPGAKLHFTGYEKQDRMEGVCLAVVDSVAIVLMSNGMVETCKRIEDEPSKSGWHAGPLRPQSA